MQKSTTTTRRKRQRSRAKRDMKEKIRRLCDDMTVELTRGTEGRPEKIEKLLFAIQRANIPVPTETLCATTEDDDTESISSRSDWSSDDELDNDPPAETRSTVEVLGHSQHTGNVGNIDNGYIVDVATNNDSVSSELDGLA